ncbi:BTB domain-containing protein [Mycena sanguinolenta]|uniref:BTB domain-containing protein n=1 Tax=Mycena sanguinolenta TaxID=230812 RepID=A0A8H6Z480_9AGAR|nr:BTB domain-containing protein [Mycena sanguinolenta]
MTSSPGQHKRTEDAITRSEIWFRDGSVVLQAQNTQFRVHFGVLARHSSVFSDMWELPQPSDESTVDGCPVRFYDSTFHSQKVIPLPVLGAMIRLGRKYDFKDLLHSAVERVTAVYPKTVGEYLAMRTTFETIEWYDGIDLDMLALLSENKIFTALPVACYRAVEATTLSELLEGIPKDDGTRASLSEGDRNRCAIGRQTLLVKQFEPGYTFGWLRKWDFTDCPSPAACHNLRETESKGFKRGYRIRAASRVFLALANWGFCTACAHHAKNSLSAGRKKIWEELPEIFGLPPWDQLKNDL